MFCENPKNIFYRYNIWQEYYDKIKMIGPDTKFMVVLDVFNIIAPNSLLIIFYSAESIEG